MIDLLNTRDRFKRCPASRFPESHRPCLNFHIGECRGVCTGQVSREKYRESVEDAMEFLSGHQKKLVDRLTEKMTACSEAMNYEEAAVYRDYILAAKSIG